MGPPPFFIERLYASPLHGDTIALLPPFVLRMRPSNHILVKWTVKAKQRKAPAGNA